MSILLDDREDRTLYDHLVRFGLPLAVVRLDFADLIIEASNGWLIGYERKRISDLISSMEDRRLSGRQLKGMAAGLCDRIELVIEGLWRPGVNGEIEVYNGVGWQTLFHQQSGISYRQVDSFLYSQFELRGVGVWRTGSTAETAHLYASRYHWWQKDYELHKSHDVLFTNNPSAQRRGSVTVMNGAPNPVTLVAAQIPGIDAKAWDIGKQFKSTFDMCFMDNWLGATWTDRKGNTRRFSRSMAKSIVSWLRGETRGNVK